jgi:uncharacterized protein YdeI (YjbR/CyaY-like superfamily)
MRTTGTADDWYSERDQWQAEVCALREIVLAAGLTECVKWGQPAYALDDSNVAIVSYRKAGAIVTFLKGSLLDDPEGELISPGENTRHGRYALYGSVQEIASRRASLEALLASAIAVERSGATVEPVRPEDVEYVGELAARLASDDVFRAAFEALTPGRRRGYAMHFAQPKNASTRLARIERCTERILAGKGLMDCVCGHSKRPPRCDGSHKHYR